MKQQASKIKTIKKPRQPKTRTAGRNLANPKNETDRYLAQLQAAFSTAPLGLAILATDLRYVRVNETLATMNGIPAEEHTGKAVRDIVPGIADEVENIVQAVLRTGNPVCNIHIVTHTGSKPGVERHWNEHWFPLKDKGGQIIGISAVIEDITDRIRIEEALDQYRNELEQKVEVRTRELKEANEMLKYRNEELLDMLEARKKMEQNLMRLVTAIEQAGEGFLLFNTEWVIEYVNPAYERISGYASRELIGKNIELLSNHTISDFYLEIPHYVSSRGEIWSGHIQRKKKSGEIMDIHLTMSPVRDKSGRIINYVSIVQDITREVRVQKIMMQSQKMEAIGTLAGGIAHDLKNIFTPILINSEMAVEDAGSDNPLYPLLVEIMEAARMGTDLVKQIMTFTRQTPEEKVDVDISSIVSETLSLLRSAIPKTIGIKTNINAGDTLVCANPTQIKQVLMNLGSNAAYAMRGKSGLLEVDVCCVDLDRDAAFRISPDLTSGSYVEVDVTDTGEGMDEMTLQRIFDPFFTTKHGEGTGMGLSVVQGIIKGHRGAISVWSKPGKGSTFKILLPKLGKVCTGSEGKPQ